MRDGGGFTLVELTIVIVIVSITALFLAGMFRESVSAYKFVDVEADLLQQARFAEERFEREIRSIQDAQSLTTATAQTLTFVDRDAATVSIAWNGTPGSALTYSRGGSAQTLASGVDSAAFGYWKEDGTAATPVVAPSATDVRRVTFYLRLARAGQSVATRGAAALRLP